MLATDALINSGGKLTDISKETHEALHEDRPEQRRIPETREAVAQEMLLFESSGSDDTEPAAGATTAPAATTAAAAAPTTAAPSLTFPDAFLTDVLTLF